MVGYTLVSGATFGREIVARLKPGLDDKQIKFWTRVGFAVACVVAVIIDSQVKNVVVDLWYAYSGGCCRSIASSCQRDLFAQIPPEIGLVGRHFGHDGRFSY